MTENILDLKNRLVEPKNPQKNQNHVQFCIREQVEKQPHMICSTSIQFTGKYSNNFVLGNT